MLKFWGRLFAIGFLCSHSTAFADDVLYKGIPLSKVIACMGKPARTLKTKHHRYYVQYFSNTDNCQVIFEIKNQKVNRCHIASLKGIHNNKNNCALLKSSCLLSG